MKGKNVPLILAVLFNCGNIMVWWKSSSITGLMSLALLVVSFLILLICKRVLV